MKAQELNEMPLPGAGLVDVAKCESASSVSSKKSKPKSKLRGRLSISTDFFSKLSTRVSSERHLLSHVERDKIVDICLLRVLLVLQ